MHHTVLIILFWTMILIGMSAVVYPWSFRGRASRILVHLPLSLFLLWAFYEHLIPIEANIRVDLLCLLPVFVLSAVAYGIKLWLLLRPTNAA
jgi:hypothetical protein